jgi:hypothetical protein
MERGCVEDQPQPVKQAESLENSEGCGWSRTHSRAPAFFKNALRLKKEHPDIGCAFQINTT